MTQFPIGSEMHESTDMKTTIVPLDVHKDLSEEYLDDCMLSIVRFRALSARHTPTSPVKACEGGAHTDTIKGDIKCTTFNFSVYTAFQGVPPVCCVGSLVSYKLSQSKAQGGSARVRVPWVGVGYMVKGLGSTS